MEERGHPLFWLVFTVCILLVGAGVTTNFIDWRTDNEPIDQSSWDERTYVDEKMGEYLSGLIGGHNSSIVKSEPINSTHFRIINLYDGYTLDVPLNWTLDDKEHEHIIHLRSEGVKLSIFRQGLNLSFERIGNYINYSNANIRDDYGPITHLSDGEKGIGGRKFVTIDYIRDPIETVEGDMNKYRQYHHIVENGSVLSFFLKSAEGRFEGFSNQVESSLATLKVMDVNPSSIDLDVPEEKVDRITLSGSRTSLTINRDEKVMGLWHQVHEDYWSEIEQLEGELGFEFDLFMDYFNFRTPYEQASDFIEKHYEEGHFMLITLQPYTTSHGKDYEGDVVIFDMLNGDWDEYLYGWARGLRDLNEPVFLRFGNEMNGDWAQWCSWFYGLDPDLYIMAWVRVHTIFEEAGADNVIFVWNPHDRTYPDYDWQAQYLYYPGDDMVDWIGLTAYNNGVTRPTEHWRDFEECYSDLYDEYMIRYSDKPFMITEFACNEIGGNKSDWIRVGLNSLFREYPNIWMAVWWNGVDDTWIYDIDSSQASLEAFKEMMAHPAVLKDPVRRD